MADRNPARLAAPLALLAAVAAVAVVVAASGSDTPQPRPAATRTAVTQPTRATRPHRRSYVVRSGDTLTVIAERTGVSLDTIQQLNPDVDPQALQTGARLKLSP